MTLQHDSLTDAQRQAVTHLDGPLLILAGPGSGKTRVVTHRIAHLIEQGVPAWQILALTFTNKAADEMRSRLELLTPGQDVWVGTFHRFCARLLRRYGAHVGLEENFTIYDAYDSTRALARTLEEADVPKSRFSPERVGASISWAKNRMIGPEQFTPRSGFPADEIAARVYPEYQRRLLASSAVDFDDLLLHVAVLLRDHPEIRQSLDERHRYILVDEYQDTNLVQYAIVRSLSNVYPNLAVTGDPDQSIYGWRGANLGNILDFESDFPDVRVVRLEQNYRSTERILAIADALIRNNLRRKHKALFTDNGAGEPVRLVCYPSQVHEAEDIAVRIAEDVHSGRRRPRDCAVFYRVNALSRAIELALRGHGVPYQIVHGLEFFQRKEIKDVMAYLRLINNPRDDVAFLRIINTPPRGIGARTIEHLRHHAARRGLCLLDAARESGLIESIATRAATHVARFVAMQDRLSLLANRPVEEILGHVLQESGYEETLASSELEEDQDRLANIQELLTAARQYDEENPGETYLEGFLEEVALVSDTDDWETETDKVTLMTLHAAKGLEFPSVYIIAVEDGLLPHERNRYEPDKLEEERRLMFVGITRAKQELQLSYTEVRDFRGRRQGVVPSSFLMELPRDQMECYKHAEADSFDVAAFSADDFAADFVEGEPAAPLRPERKSATSPAIQTAAEMADGATAETEAAIPPEAFHQGMRVVHPKYSLGKIVALSGSGDGRRATVAFATAGEKRFVLKHSKLRPVGSR